MNTTFLYFDDKIEIFLKSLISHETNLTLLFLSFHSNNPKPKRRYYHLYWEKYRCEHKWSENTLQENVQIWLIFKVLSLMSSRFHVVCLQPNAWLESYYRYGSFGTLLWLLSSRNTLPVTLSDTASYVCALPCHVILQIVIKKLILWPLEWRHKFDSLRFFFVFFLPRNA